MRYPSFDRQAAMGWARNLPQPLPIVGVKSLDIYSLWTCRYRDAVTPTFW